MPGQSQILSAALLASVAYAGLKTYEDQKKRRAGQAEAEERQRLIEKAVADAQAEAQKRAWSGAGPAKQEWRQRGDQIVFSSLEKLKERLEKTCSLRDRRIILRLPILDQPESIDAILLCAVLLWGDTHLLYTTFGRPEELHSCGRGTPPSCLFDFDVVTSFGFCLSTLSRESAEEIVRWLTELASPVAQEQEHADLYTLLSVRARSDPHYHSGSPFVACVVLPSQSSSEDQLAPYRHVLSRVGLWAALPSEFRPLCKRFKWMPSGRDWVYIVRYLPSDGNIPSDRYCKITNVFNKPGYVFVSNFDIASHGFDIKDVSLDLPMDLKNAIPCNRAGRTSHAREGSAAVSGKYRQLAEVDLATLQTGRHAIRLLERLSVSRLTGATFEHCQVIAGEAEMFGPASLTPKQDMILDLNVVTLAQLEGSRQQVKEALEVGLRQTIPPPPDGLDPQDTLDQEVSTFVCELLEVVRLRLLLTPISAEGKTPLEVIGTSGVIDLKFQDVGLKPFGSMSTRLKVAVRDHQDARDARLKELLTTPLWVAPFVVVVIAVFLALGGMGTSVFIVSVLSRLSPQWCFPRMSLITKAANTVSITASLWSLHSIYTFVGCVGFRDFPNTVARKWWIFTLGLLGDMGFTGFTTPLLTMTEYRAYEERCKDMLRQWGVRLLMHNLHEAFERKSIGTTDVLRLMDDMAMLSTGMSVTTDEDEKDGTIRVEEGQLPESIAMGLVDRFLSMEVEEEDSTATPLLPSIAEQLDSLAYNAQCELEGAAAVFMTSTLLLLDDQTSSRDEDRPLLSRSARWGTSKNRKEHAFPDHRDNDAAVPTTNTSRNTNAASKAAKKAADTLRQKLAKQSRDHDGHAAASSNTSRKAAGPVRQKPSRKQSVMELLKVHGWTLTRSRKHFVYRRVIKLGDGSSKTQTFTRSSTPSSRFYERYERRDLKWLDVEAEEIATTSPSCGPLTL